MGEEYLGWVASVNARLQLLNGDTAEATWQAAVEPCMYPRIRGTRVLMSKGEGRQLGAYCSLMLLFSSTGCQAAGPRGMGRSRRQRLGLAPQVGR